VGAGPEPLRRLQQPGGRTAYDVILLAYGLSGLDALEILKELRLMPGFDVPVVVVTGQGNEEVALRAIKLGAAGYVVKNPGYLYKLPIELENAHVRAELVRREKALRESEERRQLAQEAARAGTWEWDVQTGATVWSEMLWQMLGLEPGEGGTTLDSFTEFIHFEDRERVLRRVGEVIAEGEEYYDEFRVVPRDGGALWMSSQGRLLRSEDGQPERILGVNIDITERKRADAVVRERDQLLQSMFSSLAAHVVVLDQGGLITYASRSWVQFGVENQGRPDRISVGVNYMEVCRRAVSDGADKAREALQGLGAVMSREQATFTVEYPCHSPTKQRWFLMHVDPMPAEHGGVVVSHIDITERKLAAEALRESEEQNRAILRAIPDLMFLQSRDGTYLDYHAKESDMLLAPPEQFLGRKMQDVLPPPLASELADCFEQALGSDKPVLMEYAVQVPQGARAFEASIVSCDGDKLLSIVRDITERKEAEESLRRALAEVRQLKDRLHEENIYLQEEIRVASNFGEIVGRSEALGRVLRQAEQVAPTDTTVLVLGETGTGKELLARAIHNLSPRNKHTLVKVNCAALPAPLIESELFGHEKGAFTGAGAQRRGRFELADGGTIFLDEVGELPIELQAKLLRVLEQGEFERVGGSRTLNVDVRVVAATNRDLAAAMRKGAFRPDLYYRLNVYPITVPPLRERREDIPLLVTHLVKQLSAKMGKEIETVPQSAMTALENYDWPGNVRELRNVIERAVIITQGAKLQLSDGAEVRQTGAAPPLPGVPFDSQFAQDSAAETLAQHEHDLILRTLKRVNWKVEGPSGAARLLNIHPSTLRTRMKKLGIARS
ncbi:MAG: sigma 54-interacting transcriptional regulator, partial [Pyrinomonadaceae bacterium]